MYCPGRPSAGCGSPRPAATGFAKSCGIEPGQLLRVETDKGERIAADVTTGGARLADLLAEDLDLRSLLQLGFPKTMRWIEGDDLRFARPIRWLVCLLDAEVVDRLDGNGAGLGFDIIVSRCS